MKTSKRIQLIILPLIIVSIVLIASYLYKNTYSQIIINLLITLLGYIIYNYSFFVSIKNSSFLYEKNYTSKRHYILAGLVILTFVLSALFPLITVTFWLFPVLAVALTIFSNETCSLALILTAISFTSNICDIPFNVYAIILVASFSLILLIGKYSLIIKYGYIYIFSGLIILLQLVYVIVFYLKRSISAEIIIFPLCNLFISMGIIFVLCNYHYNKYYKNRIREYNKITDWSFPLLSEMKAKKSTSYKRTVHINYYANILGSLLDLDEQLIKTGATYSCILSIFDNDKEKLYELIDDIEFPDELKSLLVEINDNNEIFSTAESFIVSLCKTFVFALYKLSNSGKDITKLYEACINSILSTYYNSGRLANLNITFKDFNDIKNALINEKKYLKIMLV